MPRVHTVKKSRKEFPGIPVGSTYYWWKFRNSPNSKKAGGRIVRSLTRPTRQQLTQSEFKRSLYDLEDQREQIGSFEGMEEFIEAVRTLFEEYEEKESNMPEPLYEGSIVQERKDALEEWLDELENFDLKDESELKDEVAQNMEEGGSLDDDYEEALQGHIEEFNEIEYPG